MNVRTVVAAGVAVAAAVGSTITPQASAEPTVAGFGTQLPAVDTDGAGLGGYTVRDLRPSSTDELNVPVTGNVPVAGTLWEARTEVDAISGSVVPTMQFFSARTADGRSYPVLVQTFAPDLSISPLGQGGASDGHIYFDVTGSAPTEVVYDDGQSHLVWTG